MANRYWVGSTGTWTLTLTTNWSASSGGAGGASAPTAVDNVYFDLNSNAFTCTVTVLTATCASLNVLGISKPITLNLGTLYTNTLTVYGPINVATTTTNFNFSSISPNWTTATYNAFTTRSFIVYAMTATSMEMIPMATNVTKVLGAANVAEAPLFPDVASSRLPFSSRNIGETPVFPQALSTSLSFTPNYPLSLPAISIKVNERFGLNSSNTITPLPYQFWG